MRYAWRVADVRAAEDALLRSLPDGTLMQRAAAGLARRCALILAGGGGVYGARVLLLVGSGNNGGDALYAGALLARRGAAVSALLLAPARAHGPGLAAFGAAGGVLVGSLTRAASPAPASPAPAVAASAADGSLPTVDLVVDGIVGIGGSGGLRPEAAAVVDRLGALVSRTGDRPPVVAVDVPSGVTVDTGDVPAKSVTADVTVTFGCLKPAHVVGPAAVRCGQVDLVDIGLDLRAAPALAIPTAADVAAWWPGLDAGSEKYTRGVVGLATGSAQYPGAAVLSAAGALAGPAGLVRYAGGAGHHVLRAHPSVIAVGRVAEAGRVQAWVCGSGLGTDDAARTEVRSVLATGVPVVLDADALTLLVDGGLADDLRRDAPLVLTPHDREFARLAGEAPGPDRVAAALKLAAWMNAVVLLKGDRTVVATPGGQAYANPTGTPALATGGTGDVLAGLLGALLAAGLPPHRAAVAAAYVHGLAGRHAALSGPVTAPDVADALRPALAGLLG